MNTNSVKSDMKAVSDLFKIFSVTVKCCHLLLFTGCSIRQLGYLKLGKDTSQGAHLYC